MEAVREATGGDTGRVSELVGEFLDRLDSVRGGSLLVGPVRRSADGDLPALVSELLARRDHLVLVGTLDDVVIGFALCHRRDAGGHGPHGVLDGCFVETGARGLGVGRLLLDTAVDWLRAQGCGGVDGIALPGDREAKNFFEAAGFKARMLTMYRDLG